MLLFQSYSILLTTQPNICSKLTKRRVDSIIRQRGQTTFFFNLFYYYRATTFRSNAYVHSIFDYLPPPYTHNSGCTVLRELQFL